MLGIPSDPAGQKKFMMGMVPFLILGAYFWFFHRKQAAAVTVLQDQRDELVARNEGVQALASPATMRQTQQKLALFEQHVKRLEQLIPSEEEVPQLVVDMNARATDAGVEVALLKPGTQEQQVAETKEGDPAQQFYDRRTYDVQVVGPYHAVGRYLAQLGSLRRIVTPTELKLFVSQGTSLERKQGIRVTADFKINTYVIPQPPPQVVEAGGTRPANARN